MILTCPECATSYFVDDARIPRMGRMVRCSSCGAKWRADPEGAPSEPEDRIDNELFFQEVASAQTEREPSPPQASQGTEPGDIYIEPVMPPRRKAGKRPKPTKSRAPRGRSEGGPNPLVWVSVLAVIVLITGVLIGRGVIVSIWPPANKVFAAIGLPVDRLGLVIDQVKFQPTFLGGRPVLSVTGAIRNTRKQAVSTPPLRVSLLDKTGKPLIAKLARPINPNIPAGATRYFAVAIADPPAGSQKLQVAFEPMPEGKTPAPAPEPADTLLGPEPMEAKPLPAGAPDALPAHD